MSSHVTSLLADVERERKAINKVTGTQLNSAKARASLRNLAEQYFNEVRPQITDSAIMAEHVEAVDTSMQELIALCHKRGSVQRYKDLLRAAKRHLVHLDTGLVSNSRRDGSGLRTDVDKSIVTTLRALQPSAALSYEQALIDLEQPERLSWRGPAADLREALREVLDRLAPDDEVQSAAGYKPVQGTSGPTMKQKVRYILRNRGISSGRSAPAENATEAVDEMLGSFVRSVYTRSSVSTHTPTEKAEVLRVLDFIRVVLGELLEVR